MAALVTAPTVFIATAKSEYNEQHRRVERWLIRRHARVVFVRDRVTADALGAEGLPVVYAGNPLMDTIGATDGPLSTHNAKPTVTLLPGSRADAYENLLPLLQLSEAVAGSVPANFFCALAPGIDRTRLTAEATNAGWHVNGEVLRRAGTMVRMTNAFGDAVQAADVVVGLAGTANEQAAGLGKPVVTFAGNGSQVTAVFVGLQQRLLGEALVSTADWRDAARAVARLLGDPTERAARGEAGRLRMGPPGAVTRIAQAVLVELGYWGTRTV
jgi:tetraacyldisaccharide 4'-kinase